MEELKDIDWQKEWYRTYLCYMDSCGNKSVTLKATDEYLENYIKSHKDMAELKDSVRHFRLLLECRRSFLNDN